jgi:hypothetical protein
MSPHDPNLGHALLSALVIAADAGLPAPASPDAVVRTLSALVPAAIEGLIRDVVLAGPAGNRDLRNIADHAGCELAEAERPQDVLAEGLRRSRGDVLLVLRAGRAPERALFEELTDLADDLHRLRVMGIRAVPESLAARILPAFAPTVGLVALKRALPAQAPHLEALIRAARPAGLLRAYLRRAG